MPHSALSFVHAGAAKNRRCVVDVRQTHYLPEENGPEADATSTTSDTGASGTVAATGRCTAFAANAQIEKSTGKSFWVFDLFIILWIKIFEFLIESHSFLYRLPENCILLAASHCLTQYCVCGRGHFGHQKTSEIRNHRLSCCHCLSLFAACVAVRISTGEPVREQWRPGKVQFKRCLPSNWAHCDFGIVRKWIQMSRLF